MSDAPHGAGWWYAADGRWYPPPHPIDVPPTDDAYPARPPTPAPDHPPLHMADDATGFPNHETSSIAPRQRSKALWAVSGVAVILALAVIALSLALIGRGPGNFRTASQQYDVVVADIQDAEDINLTFIDTFWQSYSSFAAQWRAATPERRDAITQQFLEDVAAQIEQFRYDLSGIDGSLVSRAFDDGSDADAIRDAAVEHYRAWSTWAAAVPSQARSWSAATPSASLDEWIDAHQPELSAHINDSFHRVCAELSDDQPSDGSYEDTIYEICAR